MYSINKGSILHVKKKPLARSKELCCWWRWRELNPRPQVFCLWLYMLIHVIKFNQQLPDGQGRLMAIPDKF